MAKAKKVRNLEQSRRHILGVAFHEVFHHGFQGVSVNDIVAETKLTKGAFFHHFPTKLDLGYALVDDVLKEMILERWIQPLSAYKNPLQGILKQFQKNIGDSSDEMAQYGCPLNNLVQEMSPIDVTFKTKLQSALELWIFELEKHIKRGQDAGTIKKNLKAREVAEFLVMFHEGSLGMLKGLGHSKVYDSLHRSLKTYLETLSQ